MHGFMNIKYEIQLCVCKSDFHKSLPYAIGGINSVCCKYW